MEVTDVSGNHGDVNGRHGRVCGQDPWSGRYQVRVQEVVVALPPRNVIIETGARVWLSGLKSAPKYNGQPGQVVGFDREAKRYIVQVGANAQLRVKLENAQL